MPLGVCGFIEGLLLVTSGTSTSQAAGLGAARAELHLQSLRGHARRAVPTRNGDAQRRLPSGRERVRHFESPPGDLKILFQWWNTLSSRDGVAHQQPAE